MFAQDSFPPRRREYITVDANDPAAYDERGILRDGYRIRIPIEMMDSALPIERIGSAPSRRAASGPLVITTGLRLDQYYYPDGSPRAPRTQRHPVADADQYSANKPGYRTADAAGSGRTTVDAKADAYNSMVADLQTAWMAPWQKAQHVADAQRATADAGVDARDAAYGESVHFITNQWRTQDAPAVQTLPAGRYPISAGEGNPCTKDGRPGVLTREGDYLVCSTHQPGATRVDAVPRTMSVADAQKIKDAAWNEMVTDLTNAWKC
jgi:hypothetical protein